MSNSSSRTQAYRRPLLVLSAMVMAVAASVVLNAPLSEAFRDLTCDLIEAAPSAGSFSVDRFRSEGGRCVEYSVYLPPGWGSNDNQKYPLLVFLHGQGDTRDLFAESVPADHLNKWIESGEIPPLVIIAPQSRRVFAIDSDFRDDEQWTAPASELLVAKDLLQHSRRTYRAGVDPHQVSLQGFSRGSRAALHYAFLYPAVFASSVANGFVSDYALDMEKANASRGKKDILEYGVRIRIVIGSQDQWMVDQGRDAARAMHEHLAALGIPHEYEVLDGVTHSFGEISWYQTSSRVPNVLVEMKLHAQAWSKNK